MLCINGFEIVVVNWYLWVVLFEVLGFLLVESVDLFIGVIVFGYGILFGGSCVYCVMVYVFNFVLDVCLLNVVF